MAQPLRFSRYEVIPLPDGSPHLLGAGAEASIYLAREKESGTPAVLRVPGQAQQKNPETRHRFLEEAQEMARMKHPHVAAVLQSGDTTAGAFCAMEYCDGLTLQKAIEQVGSVPWPEAVRLALQIAGALEELDRHGLVHRGLRPTNLIVTTGADGHAHLKITDYGRVSEDAIRDTVSATKSGFVQTPAYASPEEFLNIAPPDVRSLQYALGAVLWFCLTGRPLFDGTQFEVMFHHVNSEPTWSKLPALPDAVLAVMKRLLAKSAADRFPSPAALTAALEQASSGTAAAPGKPDALDVETAALSGHEVLAQSGGDAFGKVWQARETLSGRIVSLRLLAPQLTANPASLAAMRKLAGQAIALDHPRWQRVLSFESCGTGFRFITKWIDGPTTLAWLKARQTLRLAEVQPFMAQIADAMDFAAANGITAVETAPERLHIEIEGWAGLPEAQRAALLRSPIAGWPEWSAKVCPLRLEVAARSGAVREDSDVAEAAARQNADFVRLCHRLLTGQGKGAGGHVPTAALTPEGNAFFEKHLGTEAVWGFSCRHLLTLLCEAEDVAPVEGADDAACDPMATRVVRAASAEGTAEPGQRQQAEHAWLAREREALDRARRGLAAQEAERARRIAEEQEHVEKQRRALEEQKAVLDEKRREQQRLEQELQLRAQLEFQKLQEEARSRESQMQHKRVVAEEALRQREAEFRSREQQRFAKLENLKRENDAMEERVQAEYLTLRHTEVRHERRRQSEAAEGSVVLAKLVEQEVRLHDHGSGHGARQAQVPRRRKRLVMIFMGVLGVGIIALLVAGVLTLLSHEERNLPGHEQWEAALAERESLRTGKRWEELLNWCVNTQAALRAQPEFADLLAKQQSQLADDASAAVAGLLEQPTLPEGGSAPFVRLVGNLEKIDSWETLPDRHLLRAKLLMSDAAARGAGVEALQAFLAAARIDSDFAIALADALEASLSKLRDHLRAGTLTRAEALPPLLREIALTRSGRRSQQVAALLGETLADTSRRSGKPGEGLHALLDAVQGTPDAVPQLQSQAAAIVAALTKRPPQEIQASSADLRKAAETWKLPEAWLALANIEKNDDAKLEFYTQAEKLGSKQARGIAAGLLFERGLRDRHAGVVQQAVVKLYEAADAGDVNAMMLLGDALCTGRGMTENAAEAYKLASQAQTAGHPQAFYLMARAQLRLAQISRDRELFAKAAALLEQALEKNIPGSAWLLYTANYNAVVRNPDRAFAALEKGAAAKDVNCLHILGLWIISGSPPAKQNRPQGRAYIEQAASLGHEKAREWLRMYP